MKNKNRNVAIIGSGMSKFSSHREEVNQPEMIHEAVLEALEDAALTMDDVDCVIHGNMELFEMVHQPDLWHVIGDGAWGKSGIRLTTGGTTGTTLACAADNVVASGLHDVVLAVGFALGYPLLRRQPKGAVEEVGDGGRRASSDSG